MCDGGRGGLCVPKARSMGCDLLVLGDPRPQARSIVLAESGQRWPTTRIDERHAFQFGAVGGHATVGVPRQQRARRGLPAPLPDPAGRVAGAGSGLSQ